MNIVLENYNKAIKGKGILNDINYEFNRGNIYGLYGRNGSGKTMLLRAIAGLIYPTSGRVLIDGKELHKEISFPKNMGIIIENMEMLPQYDAYTNLKLLAKIRKRANDDDIREAIQRVGLENAGDKKVKEYSLGMRQKLSIAQAIFEEPELLLLDEPTNGLDENSINDIRNVLLELKNKGTTIILASHNKEDISLLSDVVIRMEDGRMAL